MVFATIGLNAVLIADIPKGLFPQTDTDLFTFTTLLGWSLYGERAVEYLAGVRAVKPYRALWCVMAFVGAVWANEAVWAFSSIANGLMAAPNLIALMALSGGVFAIARAHNARPGDPGEHNVSEDTPTPAPCAGAAAQG